MRNNGYTRNQYQFKFDGKFRTGSEIAEILIKSAQETDDPDIKKLKIEMAEEFFDLEIEMAKQYLLGKRSMDQENHKAKRKTAEFTSKAFFIVGCVFVLFAMSLSIWAFQKPSLAEHQWQALRAVFAVMVGFACGSFAGGKLGIKGKGVLGGLMITATGGFAAWYLSASIFFIPQEQVFMHTIYFESTDQTISSKNITGEIALLLDEGRDEEEIEEGTAVFKEVPGKYADEIVKVDVFIDGYVLAGENKLTLAPGKQSTLTIKAE